MRKLIIFVLLLMITFVIMHMRPALALGQVFPPLITTEPPPIRNFHNHLGAMKGAVPGFAKKPVYFDSRLAEEHIRYLYNELDVRLIISLDHCKNMTRVITKINEDYPDVDIKHRCRRILRGKRYHERNIKLFKEIALLIGNETFYIHCRYGAHRAPTALTGAWIEKDRITFKEAFKRAGGNIKHFRSKPHHELLRHARSHAKTITDQEKR